MLITCPYCQSDAVLAPNPAHTKQVSLPVYLLACSGCDRVTVRPDNQERLVAALVGNRHGNGNHSLTVAAEGTRQVSFHTDPTGRNERAVEHSELLEYVSRSLGTNDTFTLVLRTMDAGSQYATLEGTPYTAVRGWVVVNGEIFALTGQEVWESSYLDSDPDAPVNQQADVHYFDADEIPEPYRW